MRHRVTCIKTRAGALTNLLPQQGGLPKGDAVDKDKYSGTPALLVVKHQESIVAILPPINRRQFLASTATVAVAGVAPIIADTESLIKPEIAPPTKAVVPSITEVQTVKFGKVTLRRLQEIAARNRIRQEAGLPLLSVPRELRRMKEVTDVEKFRGFTEANRKRLNEKMLTRMRRRCGASWAPTGVLAGGGLWFGAQVDKQMRKLYRRISLSRRR
jgi:hypothetical protein